MNDEIWDELARLERKIKEVEKKDSQSYGGRQDLIYRIEDLERKVADLEREVSSLRNSTSSARYGY